MKCIPAACGLFAILSMAIESRGQPLPTIDVQNAAFSKKVQIVRALVAPQTPNQQSSILPAQWYNWFNGWNNWYNNWLNCASGYWYNCY